MKPDLDDADLAEQLAVDNLQRRLAGPDDLVVQLAEGPGREAGEVGAGGSQLAQQRGLALVPDQGPLPAALPGQLLRGEVVAAREPQLGQLGAGLVPDVHGDVVHPVPRLDPGDGRRDFLLLCVPVAVPVHGETIALVGLAEPELGLEALLQAVLPSLALVDLQDHGQLLVPLPQSAVGARLRVDPELAEPAVVATHQELDPHDLLVPLQHAALYVERRIPLDHHVAVELAKRLRIAAAELPDVRLVILQVLLELCEGHFQDAALGIVHSPHGLAGVPGPGREALGHELCQRLPGRRLRAGEVRLGAALEVVGPALPREAHALAAHDAQPALGLAREVHGRLLLRREHQILARLHGRAKKRPAPAARQLELPHLAGVHGDAQAQRGLRALPGPAAEELAQPHGRVLGAHVLLEAEQAGGRRAQDEAGGRVGLEDLCAQEAHALRQLGMQRGQGLHVGPVEAATRHPEEAASNLGLIGGVLGGARAARLGASLAMRRALAPAESAHQQSGGHRAACGARDRSGAAQSLRVGPNDGLVPSA
mmetsp:Transcript_89268/g.252546  ORF Transcript_89268/g.252546 Transcript_89268/m.252546 type:complete len:539 (+) Transcript_89268:370-1986(+)